MQLIISTGKIVFVLFIVLSCHYCSRALCAPAAPTTTNATDYVKLKANIAEVDQCLIKSVYSFLYTESSLPTSLATLRDVNCKNQADGFKCMKEKSKLLPAILKRGTATFNQARQRHFKKFCSPNAKLEHQNRFVEANKCLVDKKRAEYKKLDTIFANTLIAIREKNFNDSGIELKYLCCNILTYKKSYIDSVEPECSSENKAYIEEMMNSIIPNDLTLLCDDDDKYIKKVCPTLEKLTVADKFVPSRGNSPTVTIFYLIATLGEAEPRTV